MDIKYCLLHSIDLKERAFLLTESFYCHHKVLIYNHNIISVYFPMRKKLIKRIFVGLANEVTDPHYFMLSVGLYNGIICEIF